MYEIPERYKIKDYIDKARCQSNNDVESRMKLALVQFVGYCNDDIYNDVMKALDTLDNAKLPEFIIEKRKEELLKRITTYNLSSLDVLLGCDIVKNDVDYRVKNKLYE